MRGVAQNGADLKTRVKRDELRICAEHFHNPRARENAPLFEIVGGRYFRMCPPPPPPPCPHTIHTAVWPAWNAPVKRRSKILKTATVYAGTCCTPNYMVGRLG